MPLNSARETRGFIYLKRGDAAIAVTEYEAALQMDVNRRWLAKTRMGRTAEGMANRAAALVLNPASARAFSIYDVG